jgi:hypothetical protein
MKLQEESTDTLLILGGGRIQESHSLEKFQLSEASLQRADRAIEYYHQHASQFLGREASIICSGGASPIYDGIQDIVTEHAEGTLIANHLVQNGVPTHLLKTETNSNTTTMNIVNTIEYGLLNPHEFTAERRLGIITHINHYIRVQEDLRDAGFEWNASFGIHPTKVDDVDKERIARRIREEFFQDVQPGDLAELRKRNEQLVSKLTR